MTVFAGDNFNPAADASYKNLVWENLPVPDILFHVYTPAIVSLNIDKVGFRQRFQLINYQLSIKSKSELSW